jgi:hypothetical protein
MLAFIPAPIEVNELVRQGFLHLSDRQDLDINDFVGNTWIMTHDPALIASAPTAIVGDTKEEIVELLEQQLDAAPNMTKQVEVTALVHNLQYRKDRRELYEQLKEFRTKVEPPPERPGDYRADDIPAVLELKHSYAKRDSKATKSEILAEAKVAGEVHTSLWEIPYTRQVDLIEDSPDYIIRRDWLHRSKVRLIYNPRQAKSLATRRRNAAKRKRTIPRYKYTAYNCMRNVVSVMGSTIRSKLEHVFAPTYRMGSIQDCMWAILSLDKIAKRMHLTSVLRKEYEKWIRRASVHRDVLEAKGSGEFILWFHRELKLAGKPVPEDIEMTEGNETCADTATANVPPTTSTG